MLRINGEITNFINDCEFEDKTQLMDKLRSLRKSPNLDQNKSYKVFYDLIGVAIQQAFYVGEKQLTRYKNYCNYRAQTGANNGQANKSYN